MVAAGSGRRERRRTAAAGSAAPRAVLSRHRRQCGQPAYPDEVDAPLPETRYMTDYGVLASLTKPPYTTLTAYDLNTGEIKWQVPNGDHPPTMAAGGPSNTGGVGARNGMVVTKGGLVFQAGGDGKVRAYDEDTGKVLWTGTVHGQHQWRHVDGPL